MPRDRADLLDDEGKDRQFVTALSRGLDVLRAFRAGEGMLGNQDIAERTGLPKPTVSRLTYTLCKLGYLVPVERLGKYQLGTGVLALGYAALAGMDIRRVARPLMQEMAAESDASVSLGSRDRLGMVYVETCRGNGTLTLSLDVGSRLPLATSAMGRAFLVGLGDDERAPLMNRLARHHGDDWPRVREGVAQALRDYDERGYVMSLGEWQKDVHAIGVPVRDPAGGAPYVLNCGGAAFLMPRERIEAEFGPRLVQLGHDVEAALARR